MKKLLPLIIFLFISELHLISQNCPNADFSQGNFNNWQGFTGFYGNPFLTPGIVNGRHTIITAQASDPNSCNAIQMIPPNANFSCRLGNANTGAEAEAIRYTLTVDPSNALFVYQYAVIMEDPGHSPSEQPTFNLRVLNQNNQLIDPTCGQYSVYAGQPGSNFQSCGGVRYQNWRTVGLDLSAYMGQTITLEFATQDCSLGGHYGYAYISAFCRPLILDVTYCPGDNSALIEAPSGFANYVWSTGQQGPNVSSITIANPQMFQQVSVTMTSVISPQCQVTLNTNLTPTIPTAQFTYTPACPNQATPFTDQSYTNNNYTVSQWLWNFGDGNTSTQQNPQHNYANTGNYTVELIVTTQNGCRDTVQLNVNTLPGPQANFDVTDVCFGVPADFTDQSTSGNADPIQTWQWDFGDGSPINNQQNPTHTYNTANTYNVTLSVTNSVGCTDSETAPVIIYDKPTANYTFTSQCEGTAVPFTDQSTTQAPTTITSWQWDFNGLGTNNTQNPSFNFTLSGTYDVELIVGASSGCYDTIVQQITVYDYPIVDFTLDSVCIGTQNNFTDLSTISNPFTITGYTWNFGDGNTSTQQNPQHTYATPGNYTVTLSATGTGNCTATSTNTLTVYDLPQTSFTTQDVCLYNTASFNNTTPQPQYGQLDSFDWDFGDNSAVVNDSNATHQYAQHGTYQVTLTAYTAPLNCSATVTLPITIHPGPQAAFNYVNDCLVDGIQFTDQSSIAAGNINGYNWNFGDNTTNNQQSPHHTYNADGSYTVSLIVYSDQNCTDTVQHTVTAYPMPVANFTSTSVCHESPTQFTDISSVNQPDQIVAWNWSFANNQTSTQQNPSYQYPQFGTNSATLIVTTNHNCRDTITLPVTVHPNPVVNFSATPLSGCSPLCVSFTSNSTVATGTISNLIWNVNDTIVLNGPNPTTCLFNPSVLNTSTADVILTAITDQGCTRFLEIEDYITIYPKPLAEFYPDPDQIKLYEGAITMINLSAGGTTWNWDLGDGNQTNYFQPTHVYSDTGVYFITLITTNNWGCKDTAIRQVHILGNTAIYVPNTFTPNGDNKNEFFTAQGFGIKEFTMEIFDRWGMKLFETTKMDIGWDGTYGGKECQIDVYVYQITAVDIFNKKHTYRGQVNLIR